MDGLFSLKPAQPLLQLAQSLLSMTLDLELHLEETNIAFYNVYLICTQFLKW